MNLQRSKMYRNPLYDAQGTPLGRPSIRSTFSLIGVLHLGRGCKHLPILYRFSSDIGS